MPRAQKRSERLQIMLGPEELKAIDEWRFDHRMPSRAAAVREMIRLALSREDVPPADFGEHSGSFGVMPDEDAS